VKDRRKMITSAMRATSGTVEFRLLPREEPLLQAAMSPEGKHHHPTRGTLFSPPLRGRNTLEILSKKQGKNF
jgi:hypothetical protein